MFFSTPPAWLHVEADWTVDVETCIVCFFFSTRTNKQHDADGAPEKPTAQTTKPCTNNFFDLLIK
jgi:hypothetical protein